MRLMRTTRIGATGTTGARVAAMTSTHTTTVAGTSTRAGAATGACLTTTTRTATAAVAAGTGVTGTSTAARTRVSTDRIVTRERVATSTRDGVVGMQIHAERIESRSARVTRW